MVPKAYCQGDYPMQMEEYVNALGLSREHMSELEMREVHIIG